MEKFFWRNVSTIQNLTNSRMTDFRNCRQHFGEEHTRNTSFIMVFGHTAKTTKVTSANVSAFVLRRKSMLLAGWKRWQFSEAAPAVLYRCSLKGNITGAESSVDEGKREQEQS